MGGFGINRNIRAQRIVPGHCGFWFTVWFRYWPPCLISCASREWVVLSGSVRTVDTHLQIFLSFLCKAGKNWNEIWKGKGIVQEWIPLPWSEIRRRYWLCSSASSVSVVLSLLLSFEIEVQVILPNRIVFHLRGNHIVKMKIAWMNRSH